jgi:hypothetical protein
MLKRAQAIPVKGVGRLPCHCPQCRGARIWAWIYNKGEAPRYEDDFGKPHAFVAARESETSQP